MTVRIIFILCLLCSNAFAKSDLSDHLDQVGGSTVLIELSQSRGTGFFLGDKGHIITAAHVVEDSFVVGDQIAVNIRDIEEPKIAELIAYEPVSDLALIKIDFKPEKFLFVSQEVPRELDQVLVAGFPFAGALPGENSPKTITPSYNRCNITALRKLDTGTPLLQLDSQLNPGNSGGPAVNTDGNVVGVVSATIMGGGINFLISCEELNKFLKAPTSVSFHYNSLTKHSIRNETPIEIGFYFLRQQLQSGKAVLKVSAVTLAEDIEIPLRKTPGGAFKGTLPPLVKLAKEGSFMYPGQVIFSVVYTAPDGHVHESIFVENALDMNTPGVAVTRWKGPTINSQIEKHVYGPKTKKLQLIKPNSNSYRPKINQPEQLQSKVIVQPLPTTDGIKGNASSHSNWQTIQTPPGQNEVIVVNSGKNAVFNYPMMRSFGLFNTETGQMTHYAQWKGKDGFIAGVGDKIYVLIDGKQLLRFDASNLEYEGGLQLDLPHPVEKVCGGLGLSQKLIFIGVNENDQAMLTVYNLANQNMSTFSFQTGRQSSDRILAAHPLDSGHIYAYDGRHGRFFIEHNDGYHEIPEYITKFDKPATWKGDAFLNRGKLIYPHDDGPRAEFDNLRISKHSSISKSADSLLYEELFGSEQGFRIYEFNFSRNIHQRVSFIPKDGLDYIDVIHKDGDQLFVVAHQDILGRKTYKYAQLPIVEAALPSEK